MKLEPVDEHAQLLRMTWRNFAAKALAETLPELDTRAIPYDENSVSTREQVDIKGEIQIDISTQTKRRTIIKKEEDVGLLMKGPLWKS